MSEVTIRGHVSNEDQEPMKNAQVICRGTGRTTATTDGNGLFKMNVTPARGQRRLWVFAFAAQRIGMKTIQVRRGADVSYEVGQITVVKFAWRIWISMFLVKVARGALFVTTHPIRTLMIGLPVFGLLVATWLDVSGPAPQVVRDFWASRNLHLLRPDLNDRRIGTVVRAREHLVLSAPAGESFLDITGSIHVHSDGKLEVKPGTTLRFDGGEGIYCEGSLVAIGTPGDGQIVFTAKDPLVGWGHVALIRGNGKPSTLEHCIFSYGRGASYKTPDATNNEPEEQFQSMPGQSVIGGGLLIYEVHDLKVSKCEFSDNSAESGGAVYIRNGGNVRITSCTFSRNNARGSPKRNGPGGAIYIQSSNPIFVNCSFEKNQAADKYSCGGAIYIGFRASCDLTTCKFKSNQASHVGGAIYALNLVGSSEAGRGAIAKRVVVRDSDFTSNTASAGGGAIYIDGGIEASILNCCFTANRIGKLILPELATEGSGTFVGGAAIKADAEHSSNPSSLTIESSDVALGLGTNSILLNDGDSALDAQERSVILVGRNVQSEIYANDDAIVIVDSPIGAAAYGTGNGNRVIDTVVLHHVSAINWRAADFRLEFGSALATFDREFDVGDKPIDELKYDWRLCKAIFQLYKVSPHYLINREGKIYRFVREENVAYHAGTSKMPPPDKRNGVNSFSVGVELISSHPDDDPQIAAGQIEAFTNAQYDALERLLGFLQARHEIKFLVGHDEIALGRKKDPGPLFKWNRFRDEGNYRPIVKRDCGE